MVLLGQLGLGLVLILDCLYYIP